MVGEIATQITHRDSTDFDKSYEQCCFYDMIFNLTTYPFRDGMLYIDIRCKCAYCDTKEYSRSKHTEGSTGGSTDSWEVLRKSPGCMCGIPACEDCCCSRIQGFVRLRGTKFKEVKAILKSGNWGVLNTLTDQWIRGGEIDLTGKKNCKPPLPSGWHAGSDMPTNITELNCCR